MEKGRRVNEFHSRRQFMMGGAALAERGISAKLRGADGQKGPQTFPARANQMFG